MDASSGLRVREFPLPRTEADLGTLREAAVNTGL
jgi:hypothetical protein